MNRSPASPLPLLKELVSLPSVNPSFLPDGHEWAGESKVEALLAETGRRAGLEVRFQKVVGSRRNVLVRYRPTGRIQHRILLAPHMDTVGVDSEKQFKPEVNNGRLYGRGACDTKGCLASFLSAVIQVSQSKDRPRHTEILFVGFIDEEIHQQGSRHFADTNRLKIDLAIVGEPTRLQCVTAHKGNVWITMQTRGKAAHGSRPELGKNAVLEMAKAVQVLETDYAAQLKQKHHALLGSPTVNVGWIQGGVQANIVPDQCEIQVDRRTIPGETARSVRSEINSLMKRHGLRVRMNPSRPHSALPLETDPETPMVQTLLKTLKQTHPKGVDYFCDASVLAQSGIPSVVFGPGDIAQAHTTQEWISVRQLEQATRQLTAFLGQMP